MRIYVIGFSSYNAIENYFHNKELIFWGEGLFVLCLLCWWVVCVWFEVVLFLLFVCVRFWFFGWFVF